MNGFSQTAIGIANQIVAVSFLGYDERSIAALVFERTFVNRCVGDSRKPWAAGVEAQRCVGQRVNGNGIDPAITRRTSGLERMRDDGMAALYGVGRSK